MAPSHASWSTSEGTCDTVFPRRPDDPRSQKGMAMSRVTPYSAGGSRDHRQVALTNAALVCWAIPVVALVATGSYLLTGATTTVAPTGAVWSVVRHAGPALMFGLGIGLGVLALGRSAVRSRWTVAVIVLNGVGLIAAALLVAGPTIAATLR